MDTTLVISSHLPDLLSQYITVRAERLALDKQAADVKKFEEELKSAIIAKYKEQGITGMGGILGTVNMSKIEEPVAQDWLSIWGYIRENGEFELLHKRLTNTAVRERWDAGVEIPGVGKQDVYRLSVSGAK
jgi:hypothetical protein